MLPQPKVIVVGASGNIGKATLAALTSRHAGKVATYAGVRNPSKFDAGMENVHVIQADMGDEYALTEVLKGYDRAFLVVPGHEERTQLGLNGVEAVKKSASIKFMLLLSVIVTGTDCVFGKQFEPIEKLAKESGVDYAIVRLPVFMENNFAHIASIKEQGTFYDPRDPTKPHSAVAVADVGKAAADILANPVIHVGTTYNLVGPAMCVNDFAAALTKTLDRVVKPTTISYDAAREAFIGMGLAQWQVDGLLEEFREVDEGSSITNVADTGDIEKITGEKATTIEQWVEQNIAAFQ